jgi:hypothetical protein
MEALAVQEPLDVAQQFEPVVAASDVKRRYGVNSICVKALRGVPERPAGGVPTTDIRASKLSWGRT